MPVRNASQRQLDEDDILPAGPNLSSFTLETSNALLSPFGSHFRW
jgi:hypothetical protein